MGWSDFEVLRFFIIEIANDMWISIQEALQMWLSWKLVVIVASSNKPWKNRPNEFHSICESKDVAKKVF